jgi:hypothetical protein
MKMKNGLLTQFTKEVFSHSHVSKQAPTMITSEKYANNGFLLAG